MDILVWLPNYCVTMDGFVHILSSGCQPSRHPLRTLELTQQLKNRGYKTSIINDQISKAKLIKRESTLTYTKKTRNNARVPLVVTYHPDLPNLQEIILRHWPVVDSNSRLQKALPERPLISYRRPPSLKDTLVRARVSKPTKQLDINVNDGCQPCGKPRCKNCNNR